MEQINDFIMHHIVLFIVLLFLVPIIMTVVIFLFLKNLISNCRRQREVQSCSRLFSSRYLWSC